LLVNWGGPGTKALKHSHIKGDTHTRHPLQRLCFSSFFSPSSHSQMSSYSFGIVLGFGGP
jgi:hypothetical protein